MPYPFKNYIPTSYQEAMTGNIGYDSQDLIDHDATPWAVESRANMDQLNAEIAELEKKVAEQRQARSRQLSEMKADPRWEMASLQFILNGDRSGMDAISQSVQAKEQLKQNAELQKAMKQYEQDAKTEEWTMNYNKALHLYDAKRKLIDPADPNSVAEFNRTADEVNFFGNKLGKEPVKYWGEKTEESKTANTAATFGQQEDIAQASVDTFKKVPTADNKSKAEAEISKVKDQGKRATLTASIAGEKTKEEKATERAAKLTKANAAFAKMNAIEKRKYLKDHPEFKSNKGELEYKEK